MDIFDVLTMIGGLCLFLFGMNVMGQSLERRAGGQLRSLLAKLTTGRAAGFLTGLGVTAVIQSSSATTVMVVGFVNSGLMTLRQAIHVIMGANVGTTVTAWVLSLGGIDSGNIFLKLLKPSSFSPVLALVGIVLYMFFKSEKKKDTGAILLGFATLMFGMETMSGAVEGLADVPAFQQLFVTFSNPILGVLAGALVTAIIQSSSASVGILQALAYTGQVTYGAAIPIIMGQNIGTCVTALISSVGTNKNARRASLVHLSFNVLGTVVMLTLFSLVKAFFSPALLGEAAGAFGIAIAHSVFNVACVILMLPLSGLLEKLAMRLIPEDKKKEEINEELDERLLNTPPLALERCRTLALQMADITSESLNKSIACLQAYDDQLAREIRETEDRTDHLEDVLATYLVKLGGRKIGERDSAEATELLKLIGDLERVADHAVNILESAEELKEKGLRFSEGAQRELGVLTAAVKDAMEYAVASFANNDLETASKVEPLEALIDELREALRTRHIIRLQGGNCSIEAGFVWSDLLTNLERISDHCSNIAGCIIETAHHDLNLHSALRSMQSNSDFTKQFEAYKEHYRLEQM